jgi:predicted permease
LLDEVRSLPTVEAAAQAFTEPLNPDAESMGIRLPTDQRAQFRQANWNAVTREYFDVVGIPIVRGRAFEDADMQDASAVIIVTESTARNLWPDQDPIGQRLLKLGPDPDVTHEVVGVARDAQVTVVGQVEPYYVYLPASPRAAQSLRLVVKGRADFASTAAAIRAAAARLDAGLAVQVSPLEANLEYWRRLSGILTGLGASLGLLALTLGAVGIYGVVAYFVGRRTREIAIRVALGARRADVFWLVIGEGAALCAAGVVIGIAGAVATTRWLASELYGISATDPLTYASVAAAVSLVTLAACYVPTRRAMRVDPLMVLREP